MSKWAEHKMMVARRRLDEARLERTRFEDSMEPDRGVDKLHLARLLERERIAERVGQRRRIGTRLRQGQLPSDAVSAGEDQGTKRHIGALQSHEGQGIAGDVRAECTG